MVVWYGMVWYEMIRILYVLMDNEKQTHTNTYTHTIYTIHTHTHIHTIHIQ